MSEKIHNFEPIDLPTAQRPVAPASGSAHEEADAPRARITRPGERQKTPTKKALLIGVALTVIVAGAGASLWLDKPGTSHLGKATSSEASADRVAASTMHAGASTTQPEHGPAALKMPLPDQSPVTEKPTSSAPSGAVTQPVAGTTPAQSSAQPAGNAEEDTRPAPAPAQQVVSLLLKRLGELEAAQKQEETARKALGDTLDQRNTALTAAMNREAGRLDEISTSLHSMLSAPQPPRSTEAKAPVTPASATAPTSPQGRRGGSPSAPTAKRENTVSTETRSDAERRVRYAIDAASPEIAIVHMAGGRAIEVHVGDVLPGYGHVTLIEQQGDAWVLRTERGTIR